MDKINEHKIKVGVEKKRCPQIRIQSLNSSTTKICKSPCARKKETVFDVGFATTSLLVYDKNLNFSSPSGFLQKR